MKTFTIGQFTFLQQVFHPSEPFYCKGVGSTLRWHWSLQTHSLKSWTWPRYTFYIGHTEFGLTP